MSNKSNVKAYGVFVSDYAYGVICFEESRNKARSRVHHMDGFDEYIDIVATRRPTLDGLRDQCCVLDWQRDVRVYYEAGWWPESERSNCDWCGLYYYEEIPESFCEETESGEMLCIICKGIQSVAATCCGMNAQRS